MPCNTLTLWNQGRHNSKNILFIYFPYNNGAHDMQPKTWPPLKQACQTPMEQWAGMSGINIQGAALCLVRVTPIKSLKKENSTSVLKAERCWGVGWEPLPYCTRMLIFWSWWVCPTHGFVVSIFFSVFSLFPLRSFFGQTVGTNNVKLAIQGILALDGPVSTLN